MSLIITITCLLLIIPALSSEYITFSYGGRSNKLFIPENASNAPLFVMLHGCTQGPDDFMKGTRMNEHGGKDNFLVLYPEQTSAANSNKCWNWFETAHQARGSGEPKLIADMTAEVIRKYGVDSSKVYVAGLSAGAAMSVIMGATYPDVYSCIGVGAGLEYKAATSMISAFTAMSSGGPSPKTQGQLAYNAAKLNTQICVAVFHGTSDYTVAFVNGGQTISQWAVTNDLNFNKGSQKGSVVDTPSSSKNEQVPGGYSYVLNEYLNNVEDRVVMKFFAVDKMGHAWSGGSTSGSYTDPKGPDASKAIVDFFFNYTNNVNPTTSPTTSHTTHTTNPTTSSTTSHTTHTTSDTTTSDDEQKLVLESIGGEDGFVGQYALDGFSNDVCKAGDKGMFNIDTYRTILSFPTFEIPQDATITRATLTITRESAYGTVRDLSVDIKTGSFNPASNTLRISDYGAAATQPDAFQIATPASDGASSTAEIPNFSLNYINRDINPNARTQFRIRGQTTASFSPNTLFLSCGGGSSPPTLTIYFE